MKLYCIAGQGKSETTLRLLEASAVKLGIEFVKVDFNNCGLAKLSPDTTSHLLYRVSDHSGAKLLERMLTNEHTVNFYLHTNSLFDDDCSIFLDRFGINSPATIPVVPASRDQVRKAIEDKLQGLPVIVKVQGGSHGQGVLKIDTYDALFPLWEHMLARGENAIVRQYIKHQHSVRLIVLNGQVIASSIYLVPADDFRSNAAPRPTVEATEASEEMKSLAIQATKAVNLEFSGVDIMVTESGSCYVAEVNFPCNFAATQASTGVDITGKMLSFLLAKHKLS